MQQDDAKTILSDLQSPRSWLNPNSQPQPPQHATQQRPLPHPTPSPPHPHPHQRAHAVDVRHLWLV